MEKITAKISGLEIKQGGRGQSGALLIYLGVARTGRGPWMSRWPTSWEKVSQQKLSKSSSVFFIMIWEVVLCMFFFFKRIYLFIFGCIGSSLRCAGFSLQWLLLLWSTGSRHAGFSSCGMWASVVVALGLSSCGLQALERRLSSCGAWA